MAYHEICSTAFSLAFLGGTTGASIGAAIGYKEALDEIFRYGIIRYVIPEFNVIAELNVIPGLNVKAELNVIPELTVAKPFNPTDSQESAQFINQYMSDTLNAGAVYGGTVGIAIGFTAGTAIGITSVATKLVSHGVFSVAKRGYDIIAPYITDQEENRPVQP